MKKLLLLLGLTLPFYLNAKSSVQNINDAYKASQLTYEKFLENRVLAAFEPALLPAQFQSNNPIPIKCGTPIVTEIKQNWRQLSAGTKQALSPYLGRPILTEEHISESRQFKIHYNISGNSAVDLTDNNNNNIPDFVEEAGRALDYSYRLIIDTLGYTPPPQDGGVNGPEYDLFFFPMGMYGYTQPENELSKTPPRYTSYIVIHNKFGTGFNTHGLDAVRVTCAHEFFHMVHLGYALRDNDRFFMEISSTWMEDIAYDEINDYYAYLDYFFENTDQPFNTYNGSHEYGAVLWNHMLEKKYGKSIIRLIWEFTAQYPALEAIDYALIQVGSSFQRELEAFSIWNYFTGNRSEPVNYYPEGAYYPEVRSRKSFSFQNDVTLTDSVQSFGTAYFSFSDPDNSRDFKLILQHLQPDNENAHAAFHLDVLSFPLASKQNPIDQNLYVYLNAPEIKNWRGNAVIQYYDGALKFGSFSEVTTPEIPPLRLFPNPFLSGDGENFRIQFELEQREWVELSILTMNGAIVKNISVPGVLPGMLAAGFHPEAEWDGTNDQGDLVGSGIYLVCLKTDSFVKFEKISVIRK